MCLSPFFCLLDKNCLVYMTISFPICQKSFTVNSKMYSHYFIYACALGHPGH